MNASRADSNETSAALIVDPPLTELNRLAESDDVFDQAVFELWRGRAVVSSVKAARLTRERADAILVALREAGRV